VQLLETVPDSLDPQAGRVHVYRLGAPVQAQEPVEETTPVVEEEPEAETGGGIPGFPANALALGLVFTLIFTAQRKRYSPFSR
jgi:hypothetical protein